MAIRLKWRYGITPAEVERLRREQDHRCAICRTPEAETTGGKLFIDHNHKTNRVRALICRCCNTAIGNVKENPEIARAIAEYIERHQVEPAA